MKSKIIFSVFAFLYFNSLLLAQEAARDTTSASYKAGYKIGTYLPIIVLLFLAIIFIRKAFKFKEQ